MTRELLLIEDNPADVELMRLALEELGIDVELTVANDGGRALELLRTRVASHANSTPSLILLDLKLGRKSGLDILRELKEHPVLRRIPVFVLTSSTARQDIDLAYARQAAGYFAKPVTGPLTVLEALRPWFEQAESPGFLPLPDALEAAEVPALLEWGTPLKAIVRSAADAIIGMTPEGIITSWNPAAEELYGYSEGEAVGGHIRLVVPQDKHGELDVFMAGILEDRTPRRLQTTRLTRSGGKLTVALTVSPTLDAKGDLIGVSAIARDVSHLHEAQELYRLAVEASPNGILMVDREGTIVLVNDEIERMFGYPREQLMGCSIELLLPERFREAHPALRRSFFDRPERRAMGAGRELFGLRRDGTELPIEIGLNPVDVGGELRVISSVVDISARKQAEKTFRLAVESSPNGMVLVAADGRIAVVNAEIERMFGYTRDELVGQPIEVLVPDPAREAHVGFRVSYQTQPRRRAMGAGRDLFGRRKNGSEIAVEIGLNPITIGAETYVLSAIVDITERKQSELALSAKTRDLERSNADLEQFAYVASHDLQEPLRMVASFTQLLKERCGDQLDERSHQYLSYALEGAERMQVLIRDLLAFSRVGVDEREPRPTDVRFALDQARANLLLAIRECDAQVTHEPTLPWVHADDRQLAEVFQNLIGNALKFRGPSQPRIHVTAHREGGRVRIGVADNGIGIAPPDQRRIFEIFQRLHLRRDYSGTGIGLAICQRIVERLGGRIWVESDGQEGSTFWIELQAAERQNHA